jgi:hypothetical protein
MLPADLFFAPPRRGENGAAHEFHPAFAEEIALDKGGRLGVHSGHLKEAFASPSLE